MLPPQRRAGSGHGVRAPNAISIGGVRRRRRRGMTGRERCASRGAIGLFRPGFGRFERTMAHRGMFRRAGRVDRNGGCVGSGVMRTMRLGGWCAGRRLFGRRRLHRRRRGRASMRMMLVIGRLRRCAATGQRGGGEKKRDHAGRSPRGRTDTTCIMPACMWYSMWQWNAQSPTASVVTSKVAVPPGWTWMVCLRGA